MGYKATKKFLLKFPEGEYEGLEIRVRSVPFGEYFALEELAKRAGKSADMESVDELLAKLAGCITEWNLEDDDDQPIAPSVAALKDLEANLVLAIISAWLDGMSGVAVPLDKKSSGGSPQEDVVSLPSESL